MLNVLHGQTYTQNTHRHNSSGVCGEESSDMRSLKLVQKWPPRVELVGFLNGCSTLNNYIMFGVVLLLLL